MATYNELLKANNQRQTGTGEEPVYNDVQHDDTPKQIGQIPPAVDRASAQAAAAEAAAAEKERKAIEAQLRRNGVNTGAIGTSPFLDNFNAGLRNEVSSRNYLDEFTGGFGSSKYDLRTGYQPDRDLEDLRAKEQPWSSKVANGLVKFGTTALGTAANTVGVAAGVVQGVADVVLQGFDKTSALRNGKIGEALAQGLDAGVSNIISTNLVAIEDKMEELFPNFRTSEERTEAYQRDWWKPSHLISGNTVGDFLKNFGFTVGAMGGGYAAMKGLSKLGLFKYSSDIMKGAAAAAAGDEAAATSMAEAANLLKQSGGVIESPIWDRIRKGIESAGTRFLKTSTQQQLVGVTLSALSEGTLEGIMGANEFLEEYIPELNRQYAEAMQTVEQQLLNGNLAVDGVLTPEGQVALERRRKRLAEDYNTRLRAAYDKAERMGSIIMGMNLPILMTSDLMQFGRLFSGGFKTNLAAVKKDLSGNLWGTALKETAKVGLTEMNEELLQGGVASGVKAATRARLSEFNDDGYDPVARQGLASWLSDFFDWTSNFLTGATDYYTDIKNLQEGAMGLFTGVLGIPGRRWKGGAIGAYQKAKAETHEYNKSNEILDNYLRGNKFQTLVQDYSRHIASDARAGRALAKGDKYTYLTEDNKDLINTVIAADNVGRLNELTDLADRYMNMSDEDVADARDYLRGNVFSEDVINRMDADEIRQKIGDRAKEIKDAIMQYKALYDDLKVRVPDGADKSMLNEMIYLAAMVNDFEERYRELADKTLGAVKPVFEELASTNPDGSEATDLQKVESLASLMNATKRSFAGNIIPGKWSPAYAAAIREHTKRLRKLVELRENDELKQQVDDMLKLIHDRENFYQRFDTLKDLSPLEWDKIRKTPDKEEKKAAAQNAKEEIESVTDINAMKGLANTDPEYVQKLRENQNANPNAKTFLDLHDTYSSVISQINEDEKTEPQFEVGMTSAGPIMSSKQTLGAVKREMLRKLYSLADSADSFLDMHTLIQDNYDDLFRIAQSVVQRHMAYGLMSPEYVAQKYFNAAVESLDKALSGYAATSGKVSGLQSLLDLRKNPSSGTTAVGSAQMTAAQNFLTGAGVDASTGGSAVPPGNPSPAPAAAPVAPPPAPAAPALSGQTTGTDSTNEPVIPVTTIIPESDDEEANPDEQIDEQTEEESEQIEEEEAQKGKPPYNYMHNAFSEVVTDIARKIRDAIRKKDSAKVKEHSREATFTIKDPALEATAQYLQDKKAYDNLALLVHPGSTLYFVIDPNSGLKHGGKHQILLAVKDSDGEYRIVGTSNVSSSYKGAPSLRNAVLAEFEAKGDPNKLFVFSKTSRVYEKLGGFTLYSYPETVNTWQKDSQRTIRGMDGYIGSQNIVYIAGDGSVRSLDGTLDTRWTPKKTLTKGSFYYITDNNGSRSKAIRLGVSRFNSSVKPEQLTEGKYAEVVGLLNSIVDEALKVSRGAYNNAVITDENNADVELTQAQQAQAAKDRTVRIHTTGNNNIDKGTLEIGKKVQRLGDLLYMQGIHINIENQGGVDYLHLRREDKKDDSGKVIKPGDQVYLYLDDRDGRNRTSVINFMQKSDLQFVLNAGNIDDMVDADMVTTNAQSLRQLNADFKYKPWNKDTGKFEELTDAEKDSIREYVDNESKQSPKAKENRKKYEEQTKGFAMAGPSVAPSSAPEVTANASAPAPAATDTAPETQPAPNTDNTTKSSGSKRQRGKGKTNVNYQVVGSRPSVLPEEVKEHIAKERKKNPVRLRNAEAGLYKELMKANSLTNMRMNDRKLDQKMKSLGLSSPVRQFLIEGLKNNPSLRDMTPYDAFIQLTRSMYYDMAKEYNERLGNKIDEKLEDYLIGFLEQYGITVRKADLKEQFGRGDIAGAFDVIEKIIWLSNNPERRNELTLPEEFSHAFVELMGSSLGYGADSEDFKYLYNTVIGTDIYKEVYSKYKTIYTDVNGEVDEYRIRKEAIGQALAVAIAHNWEERKLGKNESNKGFWNQLKDWFNRILDLFKGANISFEQTIDAIAKEILDGNTSRLSKVDAAGYNLLDYTRTLENQNAIDGGKAVRFMKWFSDLGNIITGSIAYRLQGTVYRSKQDSLHDIDMIVPASVHGIHNVELLKKYNFQTRNNPDFVEDVKNSTYFKKVLAQYPKMKIFTVFNEGHYITASGVYSENEALSEKFASLTGSYSARLEQFTDDERQQIYLFDFFLRTPEENKIITDPKTGIRLVDYKTPIREKLRMGRAKDVYDYQMWRTFEQYAEVTPNATDVLFQVTSPDYQQEIIDSNLERVTSSVTPGIDENPETTARLALTINSQGPSRVYKARRAATTWEGDTSVARNTSDFRELFNALSIAEDKRNLSRSMKNLYGDNPNMFDVWQDYEVWSVTHSRPFKNKASEDVDRLIDMFQKLEYFAEHRFSILQAADISTGAMDSYDTVPDIGFIPDFSSFDSIPDYSRKILEGRGVTKEEYESSSELMQDKLLRCAGA